MWLVWLVPVLWGFTLGPVVLLLGFRLLALGVCEVALYPELEVDLVVAGCC